MQLPLRGTNGMIGLSQNSYHRSAHKSLPLPSNMQNVYIPITKRISSRHKTFFN